MDVRDRRKKGKIVWICKCNLLTLNCNIPVADHFRELKIETFLILCVQSAAKMALEVFHAIFQKSDLFH